MAVAKGNTLLNYAGIKKIYYHLFVMVYCKTRPIMPGSHIPILPPENLKKLGQTIY